MGIKACNQESKFDLSFGEEVHGNECSKEGLGISVHKYMLVIVAEGENGGERHISGLCSGPGREPGKQMKPQPNGTEVLGREGWWVDV